MSKNQTDANIIILCQKQRLKYLCGYSYTFLNKKYTFKITEQRIFAIIFHLKKILP